MREYLEKVREEEEHSWARRNLSGRGHNQGKGPVAERGLSGMAG